MLDLKLIFYDLLKLKSEKIKKSEKGGGSGTPCRRHSVGVVTVLTKCHPNPPLSAAWHSMNATQFCSAVFPNKRTFSIVFRIFRGSYVHP